MPRTTSRTKTPEVERVEPEERSYKEAPSMLERMTPVLLVASLLLAFAVGVLWQKVQNLEKGTTVTAGNVGTANQGNAAAPSNPSGKLSSDQLKNLPKITDADHIRGSKNAKVFLIEYSDLQCPYCEQFHPTAQQVVKEYGDKVAWVYRQFPLEQIHPYARNAAEASECVAHIAGNDAFWKFVDEVFGDQNKYLTDLQAAATNIGVNGAAFKKCFDAKQYKDAIDSSLSGGTSAGVTGTPSNFIINDKGEGWLIPGALPFNSVKATIDQALQSS